MEWNRREKSPALEITQGIRVKYVCPTPEHMDAASIRTVTPIPACSLFYFEVTVLNKGEKGQIGVGFASASASLSRLPGMDNVSYGYHADDGNSYSCSVNGCKYGPSFTTGDVVGCCINFVDNVVFFTKNGRKLGTAFRNVALKDGKRIELYPCVGLHSAEEAIVANFGKEQFAFNFAGYFEECKQQARALVKQTPIAEQAVSDDLCRLVLSYLEYHAHFDAALALSQTLTLDLILPHHQTMARKKIRVAIDQGNVNDSFALIEESFPGLLAQRQDVLFALHLQHFVELAKVSQSDDIIDQMLIVANTLETLATALPPSVTLDLPDVLGLFAYSDPSSSPLSWLLDRRRRNKLFLFVNRAVLEFTGYESTAPLERICSHVSKCIKLLGEQKLPIANLLDSDLSSW